MNLCITGALGHIGSALIRQIDFANVNKVYIVDNFLTQRYPSLFDLPDGIDFQFCDIDICTDKIEKVIADSDVLIHLAAVTNAEASFHNNDSVESVNKKGLENVARLCAKHNCTILFPSSTSVYGVQEGLVNEECREEDLKPQSPYAESKLFGEKLLQKLADENGLRFVVFRLGTIFGYSIGMRFHTAVNKFIWQSALGEKLTVWRTALNQKRPYCELNDCIQAIKHTIEQDIFDGEIYNILTTNLTVGNIVDAIRQLVPDVAVELVDSPIMNQLSYNVCTAKSIQRGYTYSGSLEKSIRESVSKLRNINPGHVRIKL